MSSLMGTAWLSLLLKRKTRPSLSRDHACGVTDPCHAPPSVRSRFCVPRRRVPINSLILRNKCALTIFWLTNLML